MRLLLVIVLIALLFSCEVGWDSDRNDLLTTSVWIVNNERRPVETHRFLIDGTYSVEAGEIKLNGKWNWTKDGEIFLQTESIAINNDLNTFDTTVNSYMKIIELTRETLRIIERHELDSWDSGFTNERNFTVKKR